MLDSCLQVGIFLFKLGQQGSVALESIRYFLLNDLFNSVNLRASFANVLLTLFTILDSVEIK
jgi:hypothetical protein